MKIEKALLNATESELQINVPFTKFDKANRKVSGFATLDNVDQSGDVLTAEASIQAFETFRGNIREQHDKSKAIGKMVSFEQRDFFDPSTNKMYSGIYVTAYVSKGAPDTWEKVLDGTLSGFSVKGSITKQHTEYVPDEDRSIRFIDGYSLEELSLVDSPCNQFANVFSIEKTADGVSINVTNEVNVENVFWCDDDAIAVLSKEESVKCSRCETPMKNAGWFESVAGEDKVEKMKEVLGTSGFAKSDNDLRETKGGSNMADEAKKEEAVETTTEETVEEENTTSEENAEDGTVVNEPDLQGIAKALEEIKSTLAGVNSVGAEREAAIADIKKTVEGVEKSVETRMEDLLKAHTELAADFKTFKEGLDGVEKRLTSVESSSAIKKSADVETGSHIEKSNKQEQKPFWSSAFLPNNID
jgi:hypothetical protein